MFAHAKQRFSRLLPVCIAVAAVVALPARSAAQIGVDGYFLEIEASNGDGAALLRIELEEAGWTASSMSLRYELPGAMDLVDSESSAVIARLRSARLSMLRCGRIDLSFEVDAGSSDTEFRFRSGELWFPMVESASAEAKSKATFTIYDLDNNYAYLRGLGTPGTGAYFSRFNGSGDAGQAFSNLVASAYISNGGTATAWQNDPPSGYRAAGSNVESLSVGVGFSLTANDRAILSSSFDLIPDPADCDADDDGDSLPNWLDGCPQDPEKASPGGCGCGQADLDSDADGILDCDDNCPEMFNPSQDDADADGIGDACAGGPDPSNDDEPAEEPTDEGDPPSHDQMSGGSGPASEDADDDEEHSEGPSFVAGERDEFSGEDNGADEHSDDRPAGSPADQAIELFNEIAPAGCGAGALGFAPMMVIGLLGGSRIGRPRRR